MVTHSTGGGNKEHALASKLKLEKSNMMLHVGSHENLKRSSSCTSSIDLSSDLGSPVNVPAPILNPLNSSSMPIQQNVASQGAQSSSSSLAYENMEEDSDASIRSNDHGHLTQEVHEKVANSMSAILENGQKSIKECISNNFSIKVSSPDNNSRVVEKLDSTRFGGSHVNGKNDGKGQEIGRVHKEEAETSNDTYDSATEDEKESHENGDGINNLDEKRHSTEDKPLHIEYATRVQVSLEGDTFSLSRGNLGMQSNVLKSDRLKNVKSVRSTTEIARTNGSVSSNQQTELKEVSVPGDALHIARNLRSNDKKESKVYPKDTRSALLDSKIQQLDHRIKKLEGELREVASIEAALYSVVAEHGSSMSKVHAPARRLSRLYLHASRENTLSKRASAARSSVSGLVLVAKACGNDVPRYI